MSWDIFVMDIPRSATSVDTLPPDWMPGPIPVREEILRAIIEVDPTADLSDPSWVRVNGAGFSIEVNIGNDSPLTSFACHIRGGDYSIGFVADLLERLKLRAFDPGSPTGIFAPGTAGESLARWREYRDQVLVASGTGPGADQGGKLEPPR
jgi:hypothetical protein